MHGRTTNKVMVLLHMAHEQTSWRSRRHGEKNKTNASVQSERGREGDDGKLLSVVFYIPISHLAPGGKKELTSIGGGVVGLGLGRLGLGFCGICLVALPSLPLPFF